jgi:hypothetical protein
VLSLLLLLLLLLLLSAVDYAVTIKRQIDSEGKKVKSPPEEVRTKA